MRPVCRMTESDLLPTSSVANTFSAALKHLSCKNGTERAARRLRFLDQRGIAIQAARV
jgi:hypothetical protein